MQYATIHCDALACNRGVVNSVAKHYATPPLQLLILDETRMVSVDPNNSTIVRCALPHILTQMFILDETQYMCMLYICNINCQELIYSGALC